jgi:diaminopimelate decarboxylase
VVANKVMAEETRKVTIAGKFCESGDILIKDIDLPEIASGDVIAVPDCGAYCLAMGSNYNASSRPAVVMVAKGRARLIRQRETFADLTSHDLV